MLGRGRAPRARRDVGDAAVGAAATDAPERRRAAAARALLAQRLPAAGLAAGRGAGAAGGRLALPGRHARPSSASRRPRGCASATTSCTGRPGPPPSARTRWRRRDPPGLRPRGLRRPRADRPRVARSRPGRSAERTPRWHALPCAWSPPRPGRGDAARRPRAAALPDRLPGRHPGGATRRAIRRSRRAERCGSVRASAARTDGARRQARWAAARKWPEGTVHALCAVLRSRGRTLGVLTFLRGAGPPSLRPPDAAYAEDVAARIAAAVDLAQTRWRGDRPDRARPSAAGRAAGAGGTGRLSGRRSGPRTPP